MYLLRKDNDNLSKKKDDKHTQHIEKMMSKSSANLTNT